MKKVVFLTGTRADFGKIKSLMHRLEIDDLFELHVFITGMHLLHDYGYTAIEVEKSGFKNIFKFENHTDESTMDLTLAKTIEGLSAYIKKVNPDMIVVHGDRVEALAGAIVGSLNNTLVAHIEGGELSGTIDELIRHSVSKLSHIHFVSNTEAKNRLIQMGEVPETIFEIGSPDLDIMFSNELPVILEVKRYYEIEFDDFAIVMFHPVTTEIDRIEEYAEQLCTALLKSDRNFVVIYPNNDMGSNTIIRSINRLKAYPNFRVLPSLRFEYFLTLLKNAQLIIGNSSAGVREAPHYKIPTINIGTRQKNRVKSESIVNIGYESEAIINALETIPQVNRRTKSDVHFGDGNSASLFYSILRSEAIWNIDNQKQFKDI